MTDDRELRSGRFEITDQICCLVSCTDYRTCISPSGTAAGRTIYPQALEISVGGFRTTIRPVA